jgi:ribosomal protein S18 acetylase RimI-like enzyme
VYASTREDEMTLVPWTAEQKLEFLRMQSRAQRTDYARNFPGAEWLVVERDGEPVGRLVIHRGDDELLLMDIALLAAHRGGGIGTELMDRLFAESAESGRPVRLHVETFNRALRWYGRLGFEHVRVVNDVYVEMLRPAGAAPSRKAG